MSKFTEFWQRLPLREIMTALKGILTAGGPVVLLLQQAFGYQSGEAEKLVAAIASVVGLILLVMDQRPAAVTKSAGTVPGVQVHVDTTVAPAAVVAVAQSDDPKAKDVVPMVGDPRDDKATGKPPPADAEHKP